MPTLWVHISDDTLRVSDGTRDLYQDTIDRAVADALAAQSRSIYDLGVAFTSNTLHSIGTLIYRLLTRRNDWIQSHQNINRDWLELRFLVSGILQDAPWELLSRDNTFLCTTGPCPIIPIRLVSKASRPPRPVANRPLRLLFVAASPVDVEPVLDFESEETQILEACSRAQIDITVDERGMCTSIGEHIRESGQTYFDILYLSGHAEASTGGPVFVMEDDVGQCTLVTPQQLSNELRMQWPPVVMLAGCETAKAISHNSMRPLCEQLVNLGAPAVIGWALPVNDKCASIAGATLVSELATGKDIIRAILHARLALFEQGSSQWHLLRYFCDATEAEPLVTPPNHPHRSSLLARPILINQSSI